MTPQHSTSHPSVSGAAEPAQPVRPVAAEVLAGLPEAHQPRRRPVRLLVGFALAWSGASILLGAMYNILVPWGASTPTSGMGPANQAVFIVSASVQGIIGVTWTVICLRWLYLVHRDLKYLTRGAFSPSPRMAVWLVFVPIGGEFWFWRCLRSLATLTTRSGPVVAETPVRSRVPPGVRLCLWLLFGVWCVQVAYIATMGFFGWVPPVYNHDLGNRIVGPIAAATVLPMLAYVLHWTGNAMGDFTERALPHLAAAGKADESLVSTPPPA